MAKNGDIKDIFSYSFESKGGVFRGGITAKTIAKNWRDSDTRMQALKIIKNATNQQLINAIKGMKEMTRSRIRRLESNGMSSPSLNALKLSMGDKISWDFRGLSKNDLTRRFNAISNFISSPLSTVTGMRKFMKQQIRNLGLNPSEKGNDILASYIYKYIDKVKELHGISEFQLDYEKVAKHVMENYDRIQSLEQENTESSARELGKLMDEAVEKGMNQARISYNESIKRHEKALEKLMNLWGE